MYHSLFKCKKNIHLVIPMYCNVGVVNNVGNPKGTGCLGTVCENGVAESVACHKYNHLKFVKYFLSNSGIYKKIFWYNSEDFIWCIYKHARAYQNFLLWGCWEYHLRGDRGGLYVLQLLLSVIVLLFFSVHHFCHPRPLLVPKPEEPQTLPCKSCFSRTYPSANLSPSLHYGKRYL